jgi:serine/threonine protein kinase/predicted TPR repeat methyltransferase
VLLEHARSAAAEGQWQAAADALGLAALIEPARAAIHAELGALLLRHGRIEAARSAFDRALELDPANVEAISGRANLPELPPHRLDFAIGQEVLSNRVGSGGMLARYTVREVKRGGFGCVYIVEGPDGSLKALKTFNTRYLWSDEDRGRFQREAATWVRLDPHPNVVTAHTVVNVEGLPCIVMDYIDGHDLGFLLGTYRLTMAGALKWAFQICDGMRHGADQLGLVHRDLKPSNCMVSRDGRVKVTDFGLAVVMREGRMRSLELTGAPDSVRVLYTTVAGTPVYMAPEQYGLGTRIGPWTDVYAFGVMLNEMLTGEIPSPGGKAKRFITDSPSSRVLPARVRELVLRCVEPDPADRPGDFAEVRALLESAYREVAGTRAPRAPRAERSNASTWLERSIAFYELRLYDESLKAADRGLELTAASDYVRQSKLWHVRGMAMFGLGKAPQALDSYERALELDSDQPSLWICKSAALTRLGRSDKALECHERAIELAPDFATAWKYKATALDGLGRLEEAHAAFERAHELHPRDAQILSGWAANLRDRGHLRESDAMIDRALAIDPRQANAWLVKGNTLCELDRLDEALQCYERVLEIHPEDVLGQINRASTLSRIGRRDEADAAYERAAAMARQRAKPSTWANLLNGWSVNLREQGRLEEALQRTDQALEITADDEFVWANRARVLHLLGRRAEAIESLERALSIAPDEPYSIEVRALISAG